MHNFQWKITIYSILTSALRPHVSFPSSKIIFVSRDVTYHKGACFTQPCLQGVNFREDKEINFLVKKGNSFWNSCSSYPWVRCTYVRIKSNTCSILITGIRTLIWTWSCGKIWEKKRCSRERRRSFMNWHTFKSLIQLLHIDNEHWYFSITGWGYMLTETHLQPLKMKLKTVEDDLDLPIAIRKGTRKCTKQPLHPLSVYLYLKISHQPTKLYF
jgi:hypothetical protein